MGCALSKCSSQEESPSNISNPAPHFRPATQNTLPRSNPYNIYETQSIASLVNYDKGAPVYHGLLTGRSRPRLQYNQAVQNAPSVSLTCHPLDDSSTPPLAYDPKFGVLALSDIVMSLRYTVIVTDSPEREGYVRKIVHDVFDLIHSSVNGWSEDSEISKLNNVKPEKPFEISETLSAIFDIVDQLFEVSDGRFDPTTGVIKLAYLESLNETGHPPLPAEINRYRFATHWKKRVSRGLNSITKANANTIIDLDGISKGYCVDLISDALRLAGYQNFYVDWAGDIKAVGNHPSGRPWRTAILNPPSLSRLFKHWKEETLDTMMSESDIYTFVNLSPDSEIVRGTPESFELALATSGDYFQITKFGYHHIMRTDQISAMKVSSRSTGSVSVLATSCAIADGLATAAMTCSTPCEAVKFLEIVKSRIPEKIHGFFVIGRDTDQPNSTPELKELHCSTSVGSQFDSLGSITNSKHPSQFSSRTYIVCAPGELSWPGGFIDIDTLIPCSMCPDALVSFLVPRTLSDTVSVFSKNPRIRATSSVKCSFSYCSKASSTVSVRNFDSMKLTLVVAEVFAYEKIALVIASVQEANFMGYESLCVEVDGFAKHVELKHSSLCADSSYPSVVDHAKECFSSVPSTVCVLVTTAADGTSYGFTATSLVISNHAPEVFCFNVMHSSTFFAAFSGCGSSVTAYVLAEGAEELAEAFASNALFETHSRKAITDMSLCKFQGVARHVEMVADHGIVLGEMTRHTPLISSKRSLLWHRRRYISFNP